MNSHDEDLRSQVLQNTLEQISSVSPEDASECCVICLGDLVEQCEAQPCQHNNFDYICLVTWVQEHPTCPLCKTDIREIRYDLSENGKQAKVHKISERPEVNKSGQTGERRAVLTPLPERQNSVYGRSEQMLLHDGYEAIQRRRFIYRNNLYSLHVGSNKQQPISSRYRELSPQLFRTDPELVSRARTWLSRELRVFQFLYTNDDPPQNHDLVRRPRPSKAEFLHEYIIAILQTIDLQDSTGQAEEMIRDYLGRRHAQLFLHELKAWLRSPYRWLSAWDRAVQYSDENTFPRRELH